MDRICSIAYNLEMPDLTQGQIDALRMHIAAVREALDAFERALLEPDSGGSAELQITPEVKDLLDRVPEDEVNRLSDVVPTLGEIRKETDKPKPRRD